MLQHDGLVQEAKFEVGANVSSKDFERALRVLTAPVAVAHPPFYKYNLTAQ